MTGIAELLGPDYPGRISAAIWLGLVIGAALCSTPATASQEWMTPAEITKLQDEQGLAKRTGLYMSAAKLRIEKARERLSGKSSAEGDPLEFHSVADMILGCRSALRASMIGIQDQVTYKKAESAEITKALKELKDTAEDLLPELERIRKQAVDKRDEPLYRAVVECIQYAESAARGAKDAIERMKKEERPKSKP